MLIVKPANV